MEVYLYDKNKWVLVQLWCIMYIWLATLFSLVVQKKPHSKLFLLLYHVPDIAKVTNAPQLDKNHYFYLPGLSTILCKLKTTGTESGFKPGFGFQI